MKKLILLGLATLITFSASAQIEMYMEKQEPQASKPTAIEVKNKLFPIEHSYVFMSSLSDYFKAPNLIGDTLFSVPEKIEGESEDAFNCVLTLNATKDTVRIKKLPVGEYFYVRDILPASLVNYLLLNDFANKVFVSDTFYHHSYKKGRYIIPKKLTATVNGTGYYNTPCWIYLCGKLGHMSEEDCVNSAQDNEALYVLENNGTTYYVRSGGKYLQGRRSFPEEGSNKPGKKIYYAHLSSFISVKSYNFLKEKYLGKELYAHGGVVEGYPSRRKDYVRLSKEVCKLEKVFVKDGVLCGEIRNVETNKIELVYILEVEQLKIWADSNVAEELIKFTKSDQSNAIETVMQIMNNEANLAVDSVFRINCKAIDTKYSRNYCLKIAADSLLSKWSYQEEQIALAKKKQQDQYKAEILNKYGKKFGNLVIEGKVCLGMSKEMCLEALGYPCKENSSETALGKIDIWTYDCILYNAGYIPNLTHITFTNGKISGITKLSE